MAEKRQRRTLEDQYRKRRVFVAQYYDKLKGSSQDGLILPTLAEFRKLPIVKCLQSDSSMPITGFSEELERPLIVQMIRQNLDAWQKDARSALGQLLGEFSWKSSNRDKLHPVERPNVRFRCLKCDAKKASTGLYRSLSFAEACQHQCPWLNKKEQAKAAWKATNFRLDPQV